MPDASPKMSLNAETGLARDWCEYDPALISESTSRTNFIDRSHDLLRLQLVFALRPAPPAKGDGGIPSAALVRLMSETKCRHAREATSSLL